MGMTPRAARFLLFAAPALTFFLASCGASTEFYTAVETNVAQGRYAAALEGVRANADAYGDKNTVLYKMDMGALFHYAGEPDSSTAYLLDAEREIDDLYTRSVSLTALSMVLNDNVLPYEGEDFEKVLVNVFLALNFAEKGLPDEAVVEARKVDLKLRTYAQRYEGKNVYQEDAFARYLAGVLYESAGELNDAFISYRKAYEAYEQYAVHFATHAPGFLLDDLVRTAELLSFSQEAQQYRDRGGAPFQKTRRDWGSVVVVAYAGRGPIKTEVRPTVSIADDAGIIHTFQVALPTFTPRFIGGRFYDVDIRSVTDSTVVIEDRTEIAEDVTVIASRVLDDRLGLVYLKSGGRALLKFLAAEKAKSALKKKGEDEDGKKEGSGTTFVNILGSIAVDLLVGATERADVRTWRTLPAQFQLARIHLAPGTYRVRAAASDGGYVLPSETVTVRSGKTTFLIVDDIR